MSLFPLRNCETTHRCSTACSLIVLMCLRCLSSGASAMKQTTISGPFHDY